MQRFLTTLTGAGATIGRERFFVAGVGLFVVKFVIDRLVALLAFGRGWSVLNYLIPNETYSLASLPAADRSFYLTMMAIALPFVVIGVVLTCRRLRSAGLPAWLVVLFFVPAINLIFFAILSVAPEARALASVATEPRSMPMESKPSVGDATVLPYSRPDLAGGRGRGWAQWLPENPRSSLFVASLLPMPFAVGLVVLSAMYLENYGWGMFVATPFSLGLAAAVIHGYRAPRTPGQCLGAAMLATVFAAVALFAFALEGAVCIIMLLPLALPLAVFGGGVGYMIQARPMRGVGLSNTLWAMLITLPLMLGAESRFRPAPSVFQVTSSVEIYAPPSRVWRNVVEFSEIGGDPEWIFRAGLAYPIRAHIDGAGVGATRYCEFSTGAFVEPIAVWDEPRLLKFSVTQNPAPMREWSPFRIHPPHLDNFLVSRGGQFRLVALPGNRTLLEGTTWYEHGLWPEAYWRWWSDFIIHRIHLRVLKHVRNLSETSEARMANYPGGR